jgi:hypothetical protein
MIHNMQDFEGYHHLEAPHVALRDQWPPMDESQLSPLDHSFLHRSIYLPIDPPWTQHLSVWPRIQDSVSPGLHHQHEANMYQSWNWHYSSLADHSGSSSLYTGESMSERHTPPVLSPLPAVIPYSPAPVPKEMLSLRPGMYHNHADVSILDGNSCVTMEHVQRYADAQLEEGAFLEDGGYEMPAHHEGFVPMHPDSDDADASADEVSQPATLSMHLPDQRHATDSPVIRRRRAPGRHSTPSAKVNSRTSGRRSIAHSARSRTSTSDHNTTTDSRAFPCALSQYGCTASFAAKNEWKRHVYTQHLRLWYWRCKQCPQKHSKPNDFNRKDLFIQHVRRMHNNEGQPIATTKKSRATKVIKSEPLEVALNDLAEDCRQTHREPPRESCCFICGDLFKGSGSFEDRMEHIGKHLEGSKRNGNAAGDSTNWKADESTEQWLMDNKVIANIDGLHTLAEGSD